MLKIGLTGGIGSGKTTAANFFAALGIPIIDADSIAREITSTHPAIQTKIIDHFGEDILTANKIIDRKALRQIIFADAAERAWLEKLLHPAIIAEIQQRSKMLSAPYCIIAIPLLIETSESHDLVDRVLVVDADEEIQLKRTQQRDAISNQLAQNMLNAQAERKLRLQMADDIIHNEGSLNDLQQQVAQLHQSYLQLAERGVS